MDDGASSWVTSAQSRPASAKDCLPPTFANALAQTQDFEPQCRCFRRLQRHPKLELPDRSTTVAVRCSRPASGGAPSRSALRVATTQCAINASVSRSLPDKPTKAPLALRTHFASRGHSDTRGRATSSDLCMCVPKTDSDFWPCSSDRSHQAKPGRYRRKVSPRETVTTIPVHIEEALLFLPAFHASTFVTGTL